ncbi:hypothetical protein DSO57_1022558 [Entomophthora muscae]|uniref:Uncharacterized protein n=1 Tax=Entomophthora muscae TaxID=34485 RepID=A0ACC2T3H9_9FUNG|nr:hypothetical protein DSO57_1022558 [Entomophthora muscae]
MASQELVNGNLMKKTVRKHQNLFLYHSALIAQILKNSTPTLQKVGHTLLLSHIQFASVHFSLSTTLKVSTTSEKDLPITPLLHSYFATEDITQTFISGVKKGSFVDKTKSGAPTQEFSGEKITISQEVDEIHFDAFGSDKVSLNFGSSVPYKLEFNSIGLPDVVVWNPWIEKCIATQDLKNDDYLKFICVELGNIKKPFLLSSNSPLTFGQRISLVKVE